MTNSGYEIAHFRPEHEPEVLDVLTNVWKGNRTTRERLFRWKYRENPHADGPMGIVALHMGKVVGFRGYFADRFILDGRNDNIGVLHPGDTCVNLLHRNKGLSVAMGNLAMQYDSSRYRLFMNMSCSKNSLPGYLAMGFQPLAKRVRLLRHGRSPLRWALATWSNSGRAWPFRRDRVRFGRFGNILVTQSPLPIEMAAIVAAQRHAQDALRLHQDQSFFAWRYRNPMGRYAFYFLLDGDVARGFVAINVSADGVAGEILDYGGIDYSAMCELLGYISRCSDFMVLSVFSYGMDDRLNKALIELRFSAVHTLQTLVRKGSIEDLAFPLLIRPIEKSYTEKAFMIEGVDVRAIDNWRLKPICSDGA